MPFVRKQVGWSGEWECGNCAATGDGQFADDDIASSGHECLEGEPTGYSSGSWTVSWWATWECGTCAARGETQFEDGESIDSGHECAAPDQ